MKDIICYSGGKDSTATLIHLIKNLNKRPITVFCDTGNESNDTYKYIEYISSVLQSWGYDKIITVKGDYNYLSLAIKKTRFPSMKARFCTEMLKLVPFLRWLESQDFRDDCTIVTGIRRAESKARSKREEYEPKSTYGRLQWNPLIDWSVEDVFNLHDEYNVEINPLYKKGFKRVGCFPCCNAGRNELLLIKRHFPERIDEVRSWENIVGSTYFSPRKINRKTGEPLIWGIDDHIKWADGSITGQMELGNIKEESTICAYANLGICE